MQIAGHFKFFFPVWPKYGSSALGVICIFFLISLSVSTIGGGGIVM